MKYRSLASTNILVSEIGFPIQGLTIDDEFVGREDDAIRLLQESYEAGVVLFDAADVDHICLITLDIGVGRCTDLGGPTLTSRRDIYYVVVQRVITPPPGRRPSAPQNRPSLGGTAE